MSFPCQFICCQVVTYLLNFVAHFAFKNAFVTTFNYLLIFKKFNFITKQAQVL